MAVALLSGCSPATPHAIPASPETIKLHIQDSAAPLALVHLWATWCQPCREEFPELLKIHAEYASKGLALILVSADDPDEPGPVESFLAEQHSPVGSFISTQLNQSFIEMLSTNWSGALPATFLYRNGKLLGEWEGQRTYEHYVEAIEPLLIK
jgi:thiol-disulfide isomerase/thioredoxin